jgi:hypothetical protein
LETWNIRDRSRARVGQPVRRRNPPGNKLKFCHVVIGRYDFFTHIISSVSRESMGSVSDAAESLAHLGTVDLALYSEAY